MTEREHDRFPYAVRVQFRTASSFLVAYSMNLSRGGLFVETTEDIPVGAALALELSVPDTEHLQMEGVVAWRRGEPGPDGPPGLGIELHDPGPRLGAAIDHLVGRFEGVHVLVLSGARQDRTTLARSIKTIISTAEIMQAADASVATNLMTSEVDVAVVDVDFDVDGGLATLRAAKAQAPPVPTVAITASAKLRDAARQAGADELASNPPPFAELQLALVRALSRPIRIDATAPGQGRGGPHAA